MSGWMRGRWLAAVVLMLSCLVLRCWGQTVSTSTITETIYTASGATAHGTVLVSWPAFTTASGASVQKGSTSVTLTGAGVMSVALAANAGAEPAGTYYTVTYHLSDGSTSREYWAVPVSATPLHLSAVRASVLPSSVAMVTASRQYVDQAIAAASFGVTGLAAVATSGAAADLSGLAASATVDTTNAANITSGTLSAARLPAGVAGGTCASSVAYSVTPTFAVTCAHATFHMPLTGNVTGETFTGLQAGQRITLVFQTGATAGYTVTWSAAVHGGFLTSNVSGAAGYTQANKYMVQQLVVDTDGVTLLNPGAVNE